MAIEHYRQVKAVYVGMGPVAPLLTDAGGCLPPDPREYFGQGERDGGGSCDRRVGAGLPAGRVSVIEHGGSDAGPFIRMPAALSCPMNMRRYDRGFRTEPEAVPGRRGRRKLGLSGIANGNLDAPSIMVGEKAADHVPGRGMLPPEPVEPWAHPGWQVAQR